MNSVNCLITFYPTLLAMSFSFHDGDDDMHGADVNLDELYETKQRSDLFRLELYNKLLGRIHSRIKLTSRRSKTDQFCWYVVPEVMIGAPSFDHGDCIAYLVDKLRGNGFHSYLYTPQSHVRFLAALDSGICPPRDQKEDWCGLGWAGQQSREENRRTAQPVEGMEKA